jgi:hypothetical protein
VYWRLNLKWKSKRKEKEKKKEKTIPGSPATILAHLPFTPVWPTLPRAPRWRWGPLVSVSTWFVSRRRFHAGPACHHLSRAPHAVPRREHRIGARWLCAPHPRLVANTGPHFDHVPSLNRVVPAASKIAAESGEFAPPTRLRAMCSTPPRVIIKACTPSLVYSVSHDLVSNLVIMRCRGKPVVTRNLRASHRRGWFPSLRGARPRWRAMEDRHHPGYPTVTAIGRRGHGTGGNFSLSYDFRRKLPALHERTVVLRLG